MTNAQTILKMIEEVDPSDTAKLDEIDARVWCLSHEARFKKMLSTPKYYKHGYFSYYQGSVWGSKMVYPPIQYTRSRNALKAIRPEGWKRIIIQGFPCSGWTVEIYDGAGTPNLPTEELAELHAIIQAIEYERTK